MWKGLKRYFHNFRLDDCHEGIAGRTGAELHRFSHSTAQLQILVPVQLLHCVWEIRREFCTCRNILSITKKKKKNAKKKKEKKRKTKQTKNRRNLKCIVLKTTSSVYGCKMCSEKSDFENFPFMPNGTTHLPAIFVFNLQNFCLLTTDLLVAAVAVSGVQVRVPGREGFAVRCSAHLSFPCVWKEVRLPQVRSKSTLGRLSGT